ncbi:hypothetical protein BT69DRAFT_1319729 [Atractiella rhizophila]|nr:hypothetical protein BT69DRAFT_1325048 [Atractiella rhizophila]KAH8923158.1 hypothetical protein BT69DRAFT_1319729 [Atractiella rhizophila]
MADQATIHNVVDRVAAPLLVGSYVAAGFWSVQMVLTYQWWVSHWRSDHWLIKIALLALGINNTLQIIAETASVYDYTITHWPWHIIVFEITLGFSAFIVQSFLITRYWRLTRNWFVAGALACFSLGSLGAGLATGIGITIFKEFDQRSHLTTVITVYLTGEAITDLLISLALIFHLLGYRKRTSFEETRGLLQRLIFAAFETGFITSAWAMATLAAFLARKDTNVRQAPSVAFKLISAYQYAPGIAYPLGAGYGLVLLVNLLISSIKGPNTMTVSSGSRSHKYRGTRTAGQSENFTEVRIETEVQVEREIEIGPTQIALTRMEAPFPNDAKDQDQKDMV